MSQKSFLSWIYLDPLLWILPHTLEFIDPSVFASLLVNFFLLKSIILSGLLLAICLYEN